MWDFFKFARTPGADPDGPVTVPPAYASQLPTLARQELIRVVLRDTLKKYGIPKGWIGCKVTPLARHPKDEAHQVHLLVQQWQPRLMDFAPLLQEKMWLALSQYAPDTDRDDFTFSWEFAPDCGCPFDTMPQAAFWLDQAENPIAAPSALVRKFDLPASEYDHRSSGFAPTQPGSID